jgi:APA family basic amino acid/polyamine antiporter
LTEKKVFVREATGLVRTFSLLDAFVLAMAFVNIGSGVFLLYSSSLAFAPGFNLGLSFLITTIMNLFVVLVYIQMTTIMPRSGGDYVFVSRGISAHLGFANNFFFTVVAILGIAWNGFFMGTTALSGAAAAAGYTTGNSFLIRLSQSASTPVTAFIVGFIIILFAMLLNMFSLNWLKRVNKVTFVIAMLAVVTWLVVFATTSNTSFVSSFNSFAKSYTDSTDSYHQMSSVASTLGFSVPTGASAVLTATLASLPLAYFTLSGANTLNFYSGEIRNVQKNIVYATIAALGVIALIDTVLGYLLFNTVGYNWLASTSYLAFNSPANYTLPASPSLPLLVSLANPNPFVIWITFFGVIFWGYLIIAAYYLIATRNIFAWSFDRLVPESMSRVSPRFQTPMRSILTITVLALIALAIYAFTPAFSYTNYTTAYNSVWIIPCFAAAAFPFVKRGIFESQPKFVRAKLARIPVMTILGLAGAFSVLYMDYEVVSNPGYAGISPSLNLLSLGIILAIFIVGVVVYPVLKSIQKRRGVDLDILFKEIPPE